MNESERMPSSVPPVVVDALENTAEQPDQATAVAQQRRQERTESRRWWIKLVLQPAILLGVGALFLAGLGLSQRLGWISSGGAGGGAHASATAGESLRYICPMMCTPPQSEPGRCPVCAMELVQATSGGGNSDSHSIQIDSRARRVAGIQTVRVEALPATHTIRAIGELRYDEGTLKTIAAYVDGRLERLYADYTGMVVNKGDHLALVYSPRLYSGQVEYLLAKQADARNPSATLRRVTLSDNNLHESAKQRLIELGMTEPQIVDLERAGEATSRMHLCAPISGTVIEKMADEGEYVKEGQAIYKLADLTTVWLMLKLFPDDAATVRYGQKVEASVHSLPGRKFAGRVAFIDPNVDPFTRTVGVRVVIPNPRGQLRIGDYANATLDVPLGRNNSEPSPIFDPELANQWIGPRHPHIVSSAPGSCPICGSDLVPASEYGFTDRDSANRMALMVPRNAVLMAGESSVIYVEVEPGQFEIRRVVLGASCGDQIAILSGVEEGEQVATRGNFLIDSQMQLAGNPSLIDPTKAEMKQHDLMSPEVIESLAKLSAEDRVLAERQKICPVTKMPLGSMGTPIKIDVNGQPIFICCMGCKEPLLEDPATHLANLKPGTNGGDEQNSEEREAIAAAMAKLPPEDRALAEQQRNCPVTGMPLGSMGVPIKVDVNGTSVFICCAGCRASLREEAGKYLAKLHSAKLSSGRTTDASVPRLPSTDVPMMPVPEIPIGAPILQQVETPPEVAFPVRENEQRREASANAIGSARGEVIR